MMQSGAVIDTARPYPYTIPDIHKCALLVIDMQRDFVEEGGFGESLGNDVSVLRQIIPATQNLISNFRTMGLPVIHTKECHKPDLSDLPPAKLRRGSGSGLRIGDKGPMGRILIDGEPGNDFVPELMPIEGELVIKKPGKGSFYGTNLTKELEARGITQLMVAGVTTEVCVFTTVKEANDRGYEILVLEDCTASYFAEYKAMTLRMVAAQDGIFGWVGKSEDAIECIKKSLKSGSD
eukprot:GFYU01000229.1.p1 GENE.GFYU01000229.1~~GFYU01000229.1.p1  ORF type:complete len:236 (+),score=54.28 GFYU01000229.1:63-770(+)